METRAFQKPGRKPEPEATSLGDRRCYRFGVRVARVEREKLEAVAKENNLTLTELFRLAVTSLVEDYTEGEVRIFVQRGVNVTSIVRSE